MKLKQQLESPKTLVSEARLSSAVLQAGLQQQVTAAATEKVSRKHGDRKLKVFIELEGFSRSLDLRYKPLNSDDKDFTPIKMAKIPDGTEAPVYAIEVDGQKYVPVTERYTYEPNPKIIVDQQGIMYDRATLQDFKQENGEYMPVRKFDISHSVRVEKLTPRSEFFTEWIIEHQEIFYSDTMVHTASEVDQFLTEKNAVAGCKDYVIGVGYKKWNLFLLPIKRPDGKFAFIGLLARKRTNVPDTVWMDATAPDAPLKSKRAAKNPKAVTVDNTDEI